MVLRYAAERWGVRVVGDGGGGDGGDGDGDGDGDGAPLPPLAPSVEEMRTRWESLLNAMCGSVRACPGAAELVERLHRSGMPLAIATSSRRASVERKRAAGHGGMFGRMGHVLCGDDDGVGRGKPAPDVYLEAARRLGVAPEECLVFEDALAGVRAGAAAGCRVVAVPDARMGREEFLAAGADEVLGGGLPDFDEARWGIDLKP